VAAVASRKDSHQAPTVLIAAHLDENKKVDSNRPLYVYHREARYKGTGDSNDAANFTCAVPDDISQK